MSFIYNSFDKILKYNDVNVIIIFDINGSMWLRLIDIYRLLGYENPKLAVMRSTINPEFKRHFREISRVSSMIPLSKNIHKDTNFINEYGLYQVLSNSNKETSKIFRDELFTRVLPEIRKNGKYEVSKIGKLKLRKLNKKINNLKQENNYLENKHTYQPSNNGYIYIVKTTGSIKGVIKTLYKIGITKNIKKRISSYKTGNPNFRLKYYIKTNLDIKQLEVCIKNTSKFRSIKKNNEIIYYETLKDLKNDILRCSNMLAESICVCESCKRNFNLNKLDTHQCKLKLSNLRYILA